MVSSLFAFEKVSLNYFVFLRYWKLLPFRQRLSNWTLWGRKNFH